MQGNWELTEAYDETGKNILNQIAFPVTAMQLTDDNGLLGTHAPMATRIVYGDSKWAHVSGKMNQAFDYANLRFNTGEYFVEEGITNRFTVEYKLQATAVAGGLTDILTILGVQTSWIQQTVYHKFIDVKVRFPEQETEGSDSRVEVANTMIWEFDASTTAAYNYKNAQGNFVLWQGWPVNKFSKGKYVFTKRLKGLNDIVREKN